MDTAQRAAEESEKSAKIYRFKYTEMKKKAQIERSGRIQAQEENRQLKSMVQMLQMSSAAAGMRNMANMMNFMPTRMPTPMFMMNSTSNSLREKESMESIKVPDDI